MSFSHKPTGLKQINKPFKSGKHRSKGELKRKTSGKGVTQKRVAVKSISHVEGKTIRKQKAKQLAKAKRDSLFEQRRAGTGEVVPRLVALIPLSSAVDIKSAEDLILKVVEYDPKVRTDKHIGAYTVNVPRWKTRLQFYSVRNRDLIAAMDIAKVADIVVFLMDPQEICDDLGRKFIGVIKAQGLVTTFGVVQGLDKIDQIKKRKAQKKEVTNFFNEEILSKSKILKLDTEADTNQFVRFLCESKVIQLSWRESRPYMLVDKIDFKQNPPDGSNGNTKYGSLILSGYLRESSLNPNNIIHITGYGDAQIEKVEGGIDPYSPTRVHKVKSNDQKMDTVTGEDYGYTGVQVQIGVIGAPDPTLQESLVRENPPDPFASEQTWPTPEELEAAEKELHYREKKVPVGSSAYQAAWILDDDENSENEGNEVEGDGDDKDGDDDVDVDIDVDKIHSIQQFKEIQNKSLEKSDKPEKDGKIEKAIKLEKIEDDDDDGLVDDEDDDDNTMKEDVSEKKTLEEEEDEDAQWPDEVEVPIDQPARIRFQKYRGLKSFRTSPWDPKENLPHDYSRIFQFQNFVRTYKKILKEHNGIFPNIYITIHLKNISANQFENHPNHRPLVISGLHKFENKISVINFKLQKHSSYTSPLTSKTPLGFHVGFRRWNISPIFSENTTYNKYKYLRFLRGTVVASAYAPICFPPNSLVVLDLAENFVGFGGLHSVEPDRIILKKIILTGFPTKIIKSKAIIRRMFYNADDVRWFKPVDLWTKYGRSGNIIEPLALKGRYKARFDSPLVNQDTVCMSLYKRIFPKWAEIQELQLPESEKDNTI